jgi:miniconductance mechanosensitive channel
MNELFLQYARHLGLSGSAAGLAARTGSILLILLVALLATWAVRRLLVRLIHHILRRNRFHWDDALVSNHVFTRLSWLVPALILHFSQNLLAPPGSPAAEIIRRLISAGFVLITAWVATGILAAINDIYRSLHGNSGKTIRGYIDAARIIVLILGLIFLIAILADRSPWGLLSLMGGLTAMTMLVFRDTILGFIAAVKLTSTDMVRVGDWIEMPAYNADGEVIEISIHAVRVRNWDKTITTIPTYGLISKSFKNWRGMSESGGRRIKRALYLDMTSIRFLGDEELEELARVELLTDYIRTRQEEIIRYNQQHHVDTTIPVNGRRQTNVGIFRAYVVQYLKHNPHIHQNMTFLVRQLEPGPTGMPLQIYVFSRDQAWARYEAIQADIFDHLIAALPQFDLRIYQQPSSHDLKICARR